MGLPSEVMGFRVWGRYAKEVAHMAKSSKQDRAEGLLYKAGGRVLQAIGSLTGDKRRRLRDAWGGARAPSRAEKAALRTLLSNS